MKGEGKKEREQRRERGNLYAHLNFPIRSGCSPNTLSLLHLSRGYQDQVFMGQLDSNGSQVDGYQEHL